MPDVGSWALERIGAAEQVGAVESKPVERLWMTLALGLWVFGGYFVVGLAMDPSRATTLFTRVDDWIPFDVTWVLIYAGVYSSMGYPLFVVRCQRLFRRVALAYFVVGGLATATFVAYPVMSIPLRPDVAVLDVSTFTGWGMRLNYFLDPPYNCFPSLHMAVATLAGLVAWKARPLWGSWG